MSTPKIKKIYFKNINVYPADDDMTPGGNNFNGGPDWPNFYFKIWPRHCIGSIPIAIDKRPKPLPYQKKCADSAIWCGPIVKHFGHMISDHLTRLLISNLHGEGRQLVFSVPKNCENHVPDFFWQVTDLWNIDKNRVMMVSEPTRFEDLIVYPQQERRIGGRPSDYYLDALDSATAKKVQLSPAKMFYMYLEVII